MLTIKSNVLASTPFSLESEGVTHKLNITQFTIADNMKLSKMQGEIVADDSLDDSAKGSLLMCTRVMTSVKHDNGDHFFTMTPQEFITAYESGAIMQLSQECNKLNPLPTIEIDKDGNAVSELETKKK